jgi:hypothetical protein
MADVETPAADPSPAAPATESAPAAAQEPVTVPTKPEEYAEWRQTGKLPGKDSSSEEDDSAPSKSADQKSGKAAPASDAGNPKRQGRTDADSRKEELNREIRDLLAKRDSLRQEVDPAAGKKDVKAEPSPAPEPELKRPERPKQENFDDWESFRAAEDKYLEDLADFKAAKRLEEYVQKQHQEALTREMQKRVDSAKERYGEEAEATIASTAKSILGDEKLAPALRAAINRSEVIVDALYVMGSDAGELSQFLNLAKNDPLEALRKWFTVEALVKEELKSGGKREPETTGTTPARGPDGKFLPPDKAEKPAKRAEAPSPPRELNGNTAPTGDERERAAKTGDFRSFKADADRRDMQRFRGQ